MLGGEQKTYRSLAGLHSGMHNGMLVLSIVTHICNTAPPRGEVGRISRVYIGAGRQAGLSARSSAKQGAAEGPLACNCREHEICILAGRTACKGQVKRSVSDCCPVDRMPLKPELGGIQW